MPELLERSGERVRELLDVEAARVVPGAAAGIALAVGACMTRGDGALMEQLPDATGMRDAVVMQAAHRYRYDRCARLPGARIVEVSDVEALTAALADAAAVLHPAHLEDAPGAIPLGPVAAAARDADVPVIVDAAFMVEPPEAIGSFAHAGGDLVCVSAKYYGGPNVGGFVYGRSDLVRTVGAIDFTGFEFGPYRIFGRAFKLERTAVAATVLALADWLETDHEARWAGYRVRAEALLALVADLEGFEATLAGWTLDEHLVDEPVNAVALRWAGATQEEAEQRAAELAARRPSIRCMPVDGALVFCVETVRDDELELIAAALTGGS
jgi:L-seryl-tRNA(Ser) seleniumtransferase